MKALKQEQIQSQLKADPWKSNRSIAAELGVNDRAVGRVRKKLEETKQIPAVNKIRRADGRLQRRANGRLRKSNDRVLKPERNPLSILPFTQARFSTLRRNTSQQCSNTVLGQIATASAGHPLAFMVALPFGGFVPAAVWCLTHLEVLAWWHWCMVGGGALFSSLTVIEWGRNVFGNLPKAIGFAVLVEGAMITSQTEWLSISALVLLVIINSVSCSVALTGEE